MAKFLLLLMVFLSASPLVRGAENLIDQFKKNRPVDEDKLVIDAMRPEEINSQVDEDGRTALFYSRHMGTTFLLLAGANPNLPDKEGRTALFRAVSRSRDVAYPIMVDLLTLAHADVNVCDKDGFTLLAWAAHEDNLPAVRLLLLLGANPAPGDVPHDHTPLFFALQQQDDKMANLLREAAYGTTAATADGQPGSGPPDQKLVAASRASRLGEVSAALAAGADINARDKDGATALYREVAERRANVVALLLLKGANPNVAKNDGRTPLMQCVTGFDMASERMLMDLIVAGADVNATARDGTTALSESVHCCNNTGAQWMIWRGASLDVHSPDGTLMQGASLHTDWPSMVELLKRAGLKEEASPLTEKKDFALFNAVRSGDLRAVEAELEKGTSANITNRYDQTALEWAVCYDHFDMVDLLLRHGADINHQHSYNGEHIIHTLASWKDADHGHAEVRIQKLVDRGANPNLLMHDGSTPLMVAARDGISGPSMEVLLQLTTNLDARDKQGMTALGLARQHGHAQVVKLLEAKGARE